MRKLIVPFLLLLSLSSLAQSWTPISGRQRFSTGIGIPVKDSSFFATAADTALIYINKSDTTGIYYRYKGRHIKVGAFDSTSMSNRINQRVKYSDTAAMLSPYKTFYPRNAISLTTTGTSGAATYSATTGVLNIPQYSGGGTALTLTTSGSSGAATYNSGTGALNIPTYTLAGLGGQPQLNGTGFVKASGTTISYDNSSYYLASNPNGYTSNTGTVTLVSGTGTVSGLTLSGTVTSSGNLTLGGALSLTSGNVTTALGFTPYNATNPAGYITSAPLSDYLPLTGGTLTSSGSTNTLNINHSSGSGIALNISKNGSGEGLTIVKGSGSGNAASITGGITLLSELNLTTKLADAHINSAATWNSKQNALNGTGFVKASGTTISYDNTSYQPLLTNPTTGTGTTNYVTKWTGTSALGNSLIYDNGTNVGIGTTSPSGKLSVRTGTGATFNNALLGTNQLEISNYSVADGYQELASVGSILSFYTGTAGGGSATERMRITSSGNVGIGTPSPTSRLHIAQDNAAITLTRGSGAYGTRILQSISDGSINFQIGLATAGTWRTFMKLGEGEVNPALFLQPLGGNVGIGTASPSEKLSVAGRLLVNTNTTDGANALQVNGSAKISSLAGTGERLVAADASGKLVVSTNISSGYYTPTITLINGITSATASPLIYTNINGIVTVTGKITINSNILTEVNELEINLPASNPNVSPNSVGGCGVEVTASAFRAQDVLNFNSAFNYAKIAITFKSNATGSKVYTFSFSYDSNYFP
jgi:hypothetical protein